MKGNAVQKAAQERRAIRHSLLKEKLGGRVVDINHEEFMAVLDGIKTCVSSLKQLAHKGGRLIMRSGCDEVIVKVSLILKAPLWFVRSHLWLREGCKDPEAFHTRWMSKHQNSDLNQEVYVHVVYREY